MSEISFELSKTDDSQNYSRIGFCLKAIGKGDSSFKQYLHIENGRGQTSRCVATDGKRLHCCTLSIRLPEGNWFVENKDSKLIFHEPADDITYPAWKNVVPSNADYKGMFDLQNMKNLQKQEKEERFSTAACSLLWDTGVSLNISYLRDLENVNWKIYMKNDRNKLLMLRNVDEDSQFAVFAPLNVA